ncbi:anaphase-promoting complex component apc8 [Coemansia sp. RSA 1813]|nr:anaphase-promoting complex component apc8 [Coemansia sp. RSA 1646]KAJ1769980.1 anaphase-promoting complex component apc8 [Coemansia sp. RSA 1843]KAJ2088105.1 anaphase-promoting complex component apc8 [Coemansia sp. RSA 986]KAJ2214829.1 anaphase-promoting complex component apc8 [Coemansia sp. RSA 487]KAJ2567838.1 anaphase-promoting complex component apc8 [Coemansia sp. RSA 1813]
MESNADSLRLQLRRAVDECSSRGLFFSAKWAAEQLCSLAEDTRFSSTLTTPTLKGRLRGSAAAVTGKEDDGTDEKDAEWSRLDDDEKDQTAFAKCLFDLRELDRTAYCLRDCTGPRAVFLRLYARYLSREKKKKTGDQQQEEKTSVDRELVAIRDELLNYDKQDAFCVYLLATVQLALGQRSEARASCVRSVQQYEYNWSAWLLLESCMDPRHQSIDKLGSELPHGWMRHAFMAHVLLELFTTTTTTTTTTATTAAPSTQTQLQSTEDFAVHYHVLEQLFPQSMFVIGLRAVRHYNMREFEEAGRLFAQLQQLDPYRLELSDIHSNILFVMEDRARLSELAHRCASLDRFRPETCCVIGNYYSLRKEHEKAVGYFQRALQLDRNYLAAWTLMGHEFIELKNTAAAIDAYRHAVDVDERDYRAWYGLGKTYEMLNMPHYACNYYSRAAALRPYDSRMWCALANCYELSGVQTQAIECYRRALAGSSECEALAIGRLAKLHEEDGDRARAAYYYQLLYEHAVKNTGVGATGPFVDSGSSVATEQDELAAACLFLAAFENDRGNTQVAHRYLAQVVDGASQQRSDEAKAMMRAISSDKVMDA